MSLRHGLVRLGGIAAVLSLTLPLAAIQPGQWEHNTEADFEPGQRQNTVVTNLGDIQLSRLTQSLGDLPEEVGIIYDVEQVGDALYIAAGPEAKLLVHRDGTIEEVATLPKEQVFSLATYDGKLLIAASGATSRLIVLDEGELRTIARLEGVRYIWEAIVDQQTIYLATGTDGKVLAVRPDLFDAEKKDENPGLTVVLDAQQPNILCLGRDQQGRLYAGTDRDGLIYRLTPNGDGGWDVFVLFDAPEPEIGALLVTSDGTVYAGTADANQARPGRLEGAAETETGRPEAPREPARQAPQQPTPQSQNNGKEPVTQAEPEPTPSDNGAAPAEPAGDTPGPKIDTPPVPVPETPQPQPMQAGKVPDAEKSTDSAAQPTPPAPTAEQRDQLRETIRRRLIDARRSGQLQVGPQQVQQRRPTPQQQAARPQAGPQRGRQQARPGNAIYRIDAHGFVHEVFRETVMILRLAEQNGHLLVATGNEGQIYRVDPATRETAVLLDLDSQQVPVIVPAPDGAQSLLIAAANPAAVLRLEPGVAREGTFTSAALDAGQISLWGKLNVTAAIPEGAELRVETRSGNVEDPEQGPWSAWSEAAVLRHDPNIHDLQPRAVSITSPPGRFLQYRLTLVSAEEASPVVDRVAIAYVVPNLPPVVASLQTRYQETQRPGARPGPQQPGAGGDSGIPEPKTNLLIEWQAGDPNQDRLRYTLEYQPSGSSRWLLLKDDIEQNTFEWNTRQVPDGWYTLRVTASDHLDNPPQMAKTTSRRSAPVLVDNTPPVVQTTIDRPERQGDIVIRIDARDQFSVIRSARYAVDSTDDWQPILPDDLIFDSTHERMEVRITDLAPGSHLVVLSISDAQGNTTLKHVMIEVE